MTHIFAHRGSAGTHPENTMLAFKEAARVKADGIELDVRLTKDGEVVIFHDDKVDRTTDGTGFVKDLTTKELKTLNAGAKFKDGKFRAEIPLLKEFLEWFKTTELVCNIEFKTRSLKNFELVRKTIAFIRDMKLEERIIFSSFNHFAIVYAYRVAPEIETAPLYSEGLFNPWIYAKAIRAKAIHPNFRFCPKELILKTQEHGIKVRPYTVNEKNEWLRLFKCKVDALITDFPEKARTFRDELKR